MNNFTEEIAKEVQRLATIQKENIDKAAAEEQKKFFIDFSSHAFDRAMAYTNIIILAGYAGIFTIWNYTKDNIPENSEIVIAILLLASIGIFIGFEIYKMISNSILVMKIGEFIKDDMTPEQIQNGIKNFKNQSNREKIRMSLVWPTILVLSIGTGYGAGFMLIFYLIQSLFKN